MFLAHLFLLLAAVFVNIFHPAGHYTLTRHNTAPATVLGKSIVNVSHTNALLPTVTPTTPIVLREITVPIIDCIGPDGKHLTVSQKTCDDFNNAWHHQELPFPTSPWGVAQKIGDHTYTMKFTPDTRMSTVQEIFDALNAYREKYGARPLRWDISLSNYAQSRADFFQKQGTLDQHAGFTRFLHEQDGFTKLGFNNVGENAAYAGPLLGVHLIEWIFGGDEEHNSNQTNPSWEYVGIGTNGIAVDVIFGANKKI